MIDYIEHTSWDVPEVEQPETAELLLDCPGDASRVQDRHTEFVVDLYASLPWTSRRLARLDVERVTQQFGDVALYVVADLDDALEARYAVLRGPRVWEGAPIPRQSLRDDIAFVAPNDDA